MDKGKAVYVVYLYLSKTFGTVSHSLVLEKLTVHCLDGRTVDRVRNGLGAQVQRVIVNGVKSGW